MAILKSVVIFGPTKEGEDALLKIEENWRVIAFCDNSPDKWGAQFCSLPVISPDELKDKEKSSLIIIIANKKHENSIAYQLYLIGFSVVYMVAGSNCVKNDYLIKYLLDERSLFIAATQEHYMRINKHEHLNVYSRGGAINTNKRRTFFFTAYNFGGECGGPSGVIFRLEQANNSAHILDNAHYIYGDQIVTPLNGEIFFEKIEPNNAPISALVHDMWHREISNEDQMDIVFENLAWIQSYIDKLKYIDSKLKFNTHDAYVFHDIYSAFAFTTLFDFNNTALIYHAQGGMYYEHLIFGGIPNRNLRAFINFIHKHCLYRVRKQFFPSHGGMDALLKTNPEIGGLIKNYEVISNGCAIRHYVNDSHVSNIINRFFQENTVKFITVAAVNEAKAIERIPFFLSDFKRRSGKSIQWIQIGDGAKSLDLEMAIQATDMASDVLWLKNKVPHDDIQYALEKCDFYIIFQKYAICDFATIEAMGRGCIPILSDVVGNNMFLENGNGFSVNNYCDASLFTKFYEVENIKNISILNKKIQKKYFSDVFALKSYGKLVLGS